MLSNTSSLPIDLSAARLRLAGLTVFSFMVFLAAYVLGATVRLFTGDFAAVEYFIIVPVKRLLSKRGKIPDTDAGRHRLCGYAGFYGLSI